MILIINSMHTVVTNVLDFIITLNENIINIGKSKNSDIKKHKCLHLQNRKICFTLLQARSPILHLRGSETLTIVP